ncbi:sensor histidine kinase [Pontimicrobium sp. IMCC45349]|uniref:sensor histidine kinase n=1 Tax=Pontimicrobium sp. IMCC45349 TaxID=3391574 RepID=UPI0039A27704
MKQVILHLGIKCIKHLFFWALVLLFYTYFFGINSTNFNYVLSFSLFLMPITIGTTYVFIYKLIPEYLLKKQFIRFGIYSAFTVIISTYLIVISIFYGLIYLSKLDYNTMAPISRSLLFIIIAVYLVVIIVSSFKLLILHLKHVETTRQLEHKILEAQLKLKEQELNYLKMQIHPHFLFNTLNTMYGFALKKANETPEMILKLSNLLDYLLYKVDKPLVLLTDELNHIEDYIELEKMRFSDTLSLSLEKNNISNTINIAPMLLLPFIENSFKHGTIMEGKLNIEIKISCYESNVDFNIKNSYSNNNNSSQGIGLKNIKKRLELLYKDKYTLNINKADSFFEVHLILNSQ